MFGIQSGCCRSRRASKVSNPLVRGVRGVAEEEGEVRLPRVAARRQRLRGREKAWRIRAAFLECRLRDGKRCLEADRLAGDEGEETAHRRRLRILSQSPPPFPSLPELP